MRSEDDFRDALAALLPVGRAWPRDPDTTLMRFLAGIAVSWADHDAKAWTLLSRESDPRSTLWMLDSWERAFGLPDECVAEPLAIADRQKALVEKMTSIGGQSRAFFLGVAAGLGYTITIREWAPFMVGVSRVGDTSDGEGGEYRWQIGEPTMRFYWTVRVGAVRVTWFRVGGGGGQVGVDPHVRIALATDLECLFNKYKPAHTQIVFDYDEL